MVPSVVLLSAIDWAPLPVPVLELRKDSRKAYPSCRAEASGACLSTRGEGSCLLCTVIGYCATEIYGCVFAGLTVSDILDTGTQIDWNLICIISTVSKTLYIPKQGDFRHLLTPCDCSFRPSRLFELNKPSDTSRVGWNRFKAAMIQ